MMHDVHMTTTTQTEERDTRIREAHERLDNAVKSIKNSADWTAWLAQASRFHKYSFNNVMLILSQCPNASLVAGGNKWKSMKRWPAKGSKALWIFAPMLVNWTGPEIAENPARVGTKKFIGFKTVPVFDVSQTDGKPLAAEPAKVSLLEGEAPADKVRLLRKMAENNGFTTSLDDLPGETNGVTDFSNKTIKIARDRSDAQRFKTFVHEIAHMLLHGPKDDEPQRVCRADAEVEAESVAWIVCDHFGVQSDGYSFGYVAGWSERDSDAVKRTGNNVMQTVKKILAVLDPEA